MLADTFGGYAELIAGRMTWSELQNLEDNGNLYTQGTARARTQGGLYLLEEDTLGNRRMWTYANSYRGNSGGPMFTDTGNGTVDIAGINSTGWDTDSNCPYDHSSAAFIGDAESYLNVTV